ncbi:MAG: PaaI family thioesterase [Candidatus Sumerlaeota bacterium]|nr:PaaI family thioesterase [Candidatus Sumerlaeota bacterium]
MNPIHEYFLRDYFAARNGIELVDVSPGYARVHMTVDPALHFNAVGAVHGGAIFTLADFAFAVASNSHGTVAMGINVSISYLKAVAEGELIAEAREVALGPRLASYRVDVTDSAGDAVALFQGMVYRKQDKLDF